MKCTKYEMPVLVFEEGDREPIVLWPKEKPAARVYNFERDFFDDCDEAV